MRQVTRKGLMTVAAATGVLAVTGGYAHADAGAASAASDSPGVLSGNSVQVPVHVPVNLCGNTVDVLGVLNPAMGNKCANTGGHAGGHPSSGGASAHGRTGGSPGVGSGNHIQAPVDVPVNICGNAVTVGGLGNAAFGNECADESGHAKPPHHPGTPHHPATPHHPGTPQHPTKPVGHHANHPGAQTAASAGSSEQLAETGSSLPAGGTLAIGAGALLGGAVLYRRARAAA